MESNGPVLEKLIHDWIVLILHNSVADLFGNLNSLFLIMHNRGHLNIKGPKLLSLTSFGQIKLVVPLWSSMREDVDVHTCVNVCICTCACLKWEVMIC